MDSATIRGICKVCGGTISRHIVLSAVSDLLDHNFEESNYRYNPQGKLVRIA
jgi:hypothetical protein